LHHKAVEKTQRKKKAGEDFLKKVWVVEILFNPKNYTFFQTFIL